MKQLEFGFVQDEFPWGFYSRTTQFLGLDVIIVGDPTMKVGDVKIWSHPSDDPSLATMIWNNTK